MIEQKVTNILKQRIEGIICIYFFGSFPEGTYRNDSDIDIAVLAKGEWDNIKRWEITGILSEELNKDVDLINLENASTVMKAQIVTRGKCIYESNKIKKDFFEMYSLSDYARLNEERKEIIEGIKKEGRVYA
jgi:predicted nucleotidyltransferase